MEANVNASVERCLREQAHRFLAYLGGVAAASLTIQGIVAGFLAR